MTVKAILWTHKVTKDGLYAVKIYTYPPKMYHSTGIKVREEDWDRRRNRIKKTHPSSTLLNAKIEQLIIEHTQAAYSDLDNNGSLLEFAKGFLQEIRQGLHPIKYSTSKNYQSTITRLEQYCRQYEKKDLRFSEIDLQFRTAFSQWLVDHGNCGPSGIAKHFKIIKKLMRVAQERDLHDNTAYQKKAFKAKEPVLDKIYLTEKEIEALESLDLSKRPHLEIERDRFLVSYYFLLRYGDSVQLKEEKFFQTDGQWYLHNVAEKTGIETIVPVKPAALDLLRKHDFDLAGDTNQESNRKIKQIAAMAGIDNVVKEGNKKGPKWMFVTTHTARRSAATNMALKGVSTEVIARLGGWEQLATLKKYLRASGVDVARVAAGLAFFR